VSRCEFVCSGKHGYTRVQACHNWQQVASFCRGQSGDLLLSFSTKNIFPWALKNGDSCLIEVLLDQISLSAILVRTGRRKLPLCPSWSWEVLKANLRCLLIKFLNYFSQSFPYVVGKGAVYSFHSRLIRYSWRDYSVHYFRVLEKVSLIHYVSHIFYQLSKTIALPSQYVLYNAVR
jgi:hypothetical protein